LFSGYFIVTKEKVSFERIIVRRASRAHAPNNLFSFRKSLRAIAPCSNGWQMIRQDLKEIRRWRMVREMLRDE